MNNVSRTMYIPLYAKAYVSRKGMLLNDPKAEQIWQTEGFALNGKAKSKWLSYWLGMRAAVFDRWTAKQLQMNPESVVIHIGCGMDSRCQRINADRKLWLDVDFPEVIQERKRYYLETEAYCMIAADAKKTDWVSLVPDACKAIVVMEGVSMYLQNEELLQLLAALRKRCASVSVLLDCYTKFAAKASRFRNPIRAVGVTRVYGIDDAVVIEKAGLKYIKEHEITPRELMAQLDESERRIFRLLYSGRIAKNMYRLYEYHTS